MSESELFLQLPAFLPRSQSLLTASMSLTSLCNTHPTYIFLHCLHVPLTQAKNSDEIYGDLGRILNSEKILEPIPSFLPCLRSIFHARFLPYHFPFLDKTSYPEFFFYTEQLTFTVSVFCILLLIHLIDFIIH